jgi:CheY-like chemotaxis protein
MAIAVPASAAATAQQRSRILIVDDDPAIRTVCSINLQFEGFVVLEAADGRRAIELARSDEPDLVITDVMMPGLDGFQLAEALHRDERTRQIPVIFLSGEIDAANEVLAHGLGALAFLPKPFDPPALAALVAGALTRGDTRDRRAAPRGGSATPPAA